ncbi:MAG: rhomboid family intramembrane serine protease [Vicinamibacteraceae bacterium]
MPSAPTFSLHHPDPDIEGDDAIDRPASLRALLHARQPRVFVTPPIIAVNTAVYVTMVVATGQIAFSPQTLVRWGGQFPPAIGGGEWWRLLTAMWMHIHPLHIVLNLVFLWQLGAVVERLLGPRQFLIVYLLSGVLAAVGSLQVQARSLVSVGASGAIFGIVGVLLAVAVAARRDRRLGALMNDLWVRLLALVAYNLAIGFVLPGIDNGAHVGGLVGGFALGWLVAHDSLQATPPLRRTLIPIVLTAALAVAAAIRADDRVDIQAEMVRVERMTTRADADYRAALTDIAAGRRTPAERHRRHRGHGAGRGARRAGAWRHLAAHGTKAPGHRIVARSPRPSR